MTDNHVPFAAHDKPMRQPTTGERINAELPAVPNGVTQLWIVGVLDAGTAGMRAATPVRDNHNGTYLWNICDCNPAHQDHGEALQCLTSRYQEAQQ